MAPKKALFDQPPPPPSPNPEEEEVEEEGSEEGSEEEGSEEGSEEEGSEEAGSEEEEESEDEPKTPQSRVNKNTIENKSTSPPQPQSNSDSEEEEGEEEEEEEDEGEEKESEQEGTPHSPSASDFIIKHITPTKPTSKDSKPTVKRQSETQKDDEKDSIINKKAKVNEEESKKGKSLAALTASGGGAGRVWSEEDVIKVLQGMIDYQDQKGSDPSADMGAFYEFVKGKFQAQFSKTQIYEKVRGLKRKFFNNVEKAEKGEDPVFSKPHECKAFELSKRIWGGHSGMVSNGAKENVNDKSNNGKPKKSGKVGSFLDSAKEDEKKNVVEEVVMDDEGDFGSKYPLLSGSFDMGSSIFAGGMSFFKENLSLIGDTKAKELERKWKKLREAEAEFLLERLNFTKELTELALEGMKSN